MLKGDRVLIGLFMLQSCWIKETYKIHFDNSFAAVSNYKEPMKKPLSVNLYFNLSFKVSLYLQKYRFYMVLYLPFVYMQRTIGTCSILATSVLHSQRKATMLKAEELNIICKWITVAYGSYANIPSYFEMMLIVNISTKRFKFIYCSILSLAK